MADKRVQVVAPDGTRGSIPADQVDQLPEGARLVTAKELAAEAEQARYDAQPTALKALGAVNTALGVAAGPLAYGAGGMATPLIGQEAGAYNAGVGKGLTAGLSDAAARKALDTDAVQSALGATGKLTGAPALPTDLGGRYAQAVEERQTASPFASGAGEAVGMLGGAAMGGATGGAESAASGVARRLLPGAAIPAAGDAIEHAVARGLGGLAARGAVGRAAATGAGMAVRGAIEGGAYAGLETTADSILKDEPITGEKLYAAVGHGALVNGALGGALGFSGSLAASGVRGLISKIRAGGGGELPALAAGAGARKGVELPAIDADAGLRGGAEAVESPFSFGPEKRDVQVKPMGRARKVDAEEPFSFSKSWTLDPDAGLKSPAGKAGAPFDIGSPDTSDLTSRLYDLDKHGSMVKIPELRRQYMAEGWTREDFDKMLIQAEKDGQVKLSNANDPKQIAKADRGETIRLNDRDKNILWVSATEPRPSAFGEVGLSSGVGRSERAATSGKSAFGDRFDVTMDPEAGIAKRGAGGKFQGRIETEDPFKVSSAKNAPRDVHLGDLGEGLPFASESPIKIPDVAEVGGGRPKGILGALSDPTNTARAAAQEQAWKAIGAGFGLQTSRFAKMAAKYFPNGTRDLGEVALRHGIVDMGVDATSPFGAAIAAAKSGTVADMVPKIETAIEDVGGQIGRITEDSGARVPIADIKKALGDVRKEYASKAGFEHVVSAVDAYEESLLGHLPAGDSIPVQSVIEQRKALDQLVFQEAKTLDPKGRVAALRSVRGGLEDAVETALDRASGQVPDSLRSKYRTLKKDYQALQILKDAATDSAARSTKGASLSLTDKIIGGAFVGAGTAVAGPIGGLVAGGAASMTSKVLRERGNAAAAAFLSRAADQGAFSSIVRRFDLRLERAAAGALAGPTAETRTAAGQGPRTPRPDPTAGSVAHGRAEVKATQQQAKGIVEAIGKTKADPEGMMHQLQEASSVIARAAGPQAAQSYTMRAIQAIAFVSQYIPVRERTDPLDPRSIPPLSHEESSRIVRAATYALKPEIVYDDFERGVITPEGIAAAKEFTPDSLVEFRTKLFSHVQDHLVQRRSLTRSQRFRLDKLLESPAGSEFRPDRIAQLQANLMKSPTSGATPAKQTGGGPPVDLKVQQTGFDAVEARMTG